MEQSILSQIAGLESLGIKELKEKYLEFYGNEAIPQDNKPYLLKRIAYKLQELAYGGISEEIQIKIEKGIATTDPVNTLRIKQGTAAETANQKSAKKKDHRIPLPGTIITKEYKGTAIQVKVLEKGFEYNNKVFKSLSSVATEITGSHWNGFIFFGL